MRKKSSFSGTCRSTNSIAWKRWLLWNKWILQWLKKKKNNLRLAKLRWSGSVNFYCMQTSLVMCMWFVFGDDWNDVLCWSRFAEHDFKRLLDRRLKRVWKTYSKEILFPVGSHVVAKAKSSKASEFKFPFPWRHFRFIIIFIF